MIVLLLICFGIVIAVPVWAVCVVFSSRQPSVRLKWWFRLVLGLGAIGGYLSTCHFIHYTNSNTRFHGAPVPYVVYQRAGPDEPWLDFVGWVSALSLPLNILMLLFLPSVLFLILAKRRRRATQEQGS